MARPEIKPMDLVEFKYVKCPVLKKETRLKRTYTFYGLGDEGPRHIVDCVGAAECGALSVKDCKVKHDFSRCPFNGVRFLADRG